MLIIFIASVRFHFTRRLPDISGFIITTIEKRGSGHGRVQYFKIAREGVKRRDRKILVGLELPVGVGNRKEKRQRTAALQPRKLSGRRKFGVAAERALSEK
jgi:hypothetical protein